MPTVIDGDTGVSQVQNGVIVQADLASGVAGTGPAFSAYRSTTQSVTSGVQTKVQCNVEEFDTDGAYDNATNYRFQPVIAGYYMMTGYVTYQASTSKTEFLTSLYKNGTIFKRGNYSALNTVYDQGCGVAALVYLNGSTDYVELYGYLVGVGSPLFVGAVASTFFQGVLVRAA
jgi:hypothetical protein